MRLVTWAKLNDALVSILPVFQLKQWATLVWAELHIIFPVSSLKAPPPTHINAIIPHSTQIKGWECMLCMCAHLSLMIHSYRVKKLHIFLNFILHFVCVYLTDLERKCLNTKAHDVCFYFAGSCREAWHIHYLYDLDLRHRSIWTVCLL